jgi:hypothetical protein
LFLLVELWQKFNFSGKNLQPEDNLCPASRISRLTHHSSLITHQDQGCGWYNNFAFQVLDVGEEAMYEIARKIGGKDFMPSLAERLKKRGELKGKEIGKIEAKRSTLIRQLKRKFGLTLAEEEKLRSVTDEAKLEAALDAILDAKDKS